MGRGAKKRIAHGICQRRSIRVTPLIEGSWHIAIIDGARAVETIIVPAGAPAELFKPVGE